VVPRSAQAHEVAAGQVLERFSVSERWAPCLPVPIERIVESTYDLEILWTAIEEPAGEQILGALQPADRRILLNERHAALFDTVIGPYRFTLAHELGHWLYDADDPNQGSLFDSPDDAAAVFCRSVSLSDGDLREVNANKFASRLLLPATLVRGALRQRLASRTAFSQTAAEWGVSKQTLTIRLTDLGMQDFLPN
jgi:hypothetical protein